MPPCKIAGGCRNPGMPISSHVCKICRTPIHNFCFQALTGIPDHPPDGFVCGQGGYCRNEAGHPSPACSLPSSDTPAAGYNCAAGSQCSRGLADMSASMACCGRSCHVVCLQLTCQACKEDVALHEGTAKGKVGANAEDVGAMPSVSPEDPTESVGGAQAAARPCPSAAPVDIQDLTGVSGVPSQANEPAMSTSKKSPKSTKDLAPQRESARIRRANEASKVQIEVATAHTIVTAAVNDAVQAYFKGNAFSKALSLVVKSNLFEGAVSDANDKLPVHKGALKKAIEENSATVHDILQKSLQPQLDKVTKEFKLKADNAGKVMDTSTGAMRLATDELKGVSADAEASADPTKEAKGGGRKGRGKKATKSASADKPGEEEALLSGTTQEKLTGVISDTFSNTLSAKVDPRFYQLNNNLDSGLQRSVQVIGQRSTAENDILQKQIQLVAGGMSDLTKVVDDNFGVLGQSWDHLQQELRVIADTCAAKPSADSCAGKDKRKRFPNASAPSTPSATQKSRRLAHNLPSSPSSPEVEVSSPESPAEPPTPPPEPKRRRKPGRTPPSATSTKPLSSIDPNTAQLMEQIQEEFAKLKRQQQLDRDHQQQPQQLPQQGPQQQSQQGQQQQPQQCQLPQQQQSQWPQQPQGQQPQRPQSQQPPAIQQQHQMIGQMGAAPPLTGHWNNTGIPPVPPRAQTAMNPLPPPHSYPYYTFLG